MLLAHLNIWHQSKVGSTCVCYAGDELLSTNSHVLFQSICLTRIIDSGIRSLLVNCLAFSKHEVRNHFCSFFSGSLVFCCTLTVFRSCLLPCFIAFEGFASLSNENNGELRPRIGPGHHIGQVCRHRPARGPGPGRSESRHSGLLVLPEKYINSQNMKTQCNFLNCFSFTNELSGTCRINLVEK